MNKDLYDILDIIDAKLLADENLSDEILAKARNFTAQGGFIGLAQLNYRPGNLEYNAKKIAKYIRAAEAIGLDKIIFAKDSLLGICMDDFIQKFPFIVNESEKWLNALAKLTKNTVAILGVNNENYAILKSGAWAKTYADNEYKTCAVGAVDSISQEGYSTVMNSDGTVLARAKGFEEQLLIFNPDKKIGKIYSEPKICPFNEFSLDYDWDLERTYKCLVQGIRDYFIKCGLKRAVIGLSGGLDSTVSAVLLVDALGKENVFGVSMPSKLTSSESKSDAEKLAQNLGIGFAECSIKPMVETTNSCLDNIFKDAEGHWNCRYKKSFTQDNVQARSRAMYLWALANEFESCIPIATSDKSESYMGYATINGDMSGGFAPIADVTKTKLFALARWMNKNRSEKNVIPESIILKKPGAELAIDPNTGKTLNAEDALMPYEFMDEIIWRIEHKKQSYEEILESKFVYETNHDISKAQKIEWLDKFYRRMAFAVYKWNILPPATIVEKSSINKAVYSQPICSGGINYKGVTAEYIESIL